MSENKNNRWWEFYFVRYFVGTVVGFGAVYFLNYHSGSKLYGVILPGLNGLKEISGLNYAFLAALGLAYCYIASAPILLLHACRSAFLYKPKKSTIKSTLLKIIAVLLIFGGVGWLSFWFFTGNVFQKLSGYFIFSITLFQILLLLIFIFKNNVVKFYGELCEVRADDSTVITEYKESYRHLREHGNAFLIVLLEISLAISLFSIKNATDSVLIIFFWMFPSCSAWFIGSFLESKIQEVQSNHVIKRTENASD